MEPLTIESIEASKGAAYRKQVEELSIPELVALLVTDDGKGKTIKLKVLTRLLTEWGDYGNFLQKIYMDKD